MSFIHLNGAKNNQFQEATSFSKSTKFAMSMVKKLKQLYWGIQNNWGVLDSQQMWSSKLKRRAIIWLRNDEIMKLEELWNKMNKFIQLSGENSMLIENPYFPSNKQENLHD